MCSRRVPRNSLGPSRSWDAYEEGERQGHGAVALDGQMIDRPIVLRAHELLEWQQQVEEQEAALR